MSSINTNVWPKERCENCHSKFKGSKEEVESMCRSACRQTLFHSDPIKKAMSYQLMIFYV